MFSGVASNIINIILLLISYPVYLQFLGYEKLGVWMVLSTVLTFMQMSNLGMGPAITKLVAEEYGGKNVQGIMSYAKTGLLTVSATGIIALTVLILLKKPIIGIFKLGPENAALALSLLPFVGILTVYAFLVQILTATLTGLGRIDQVNYRDSACRAVSLGVAVVLLISGQGIASLLIASAASSVVMHISSIILIRKIINLQILKLSWDQKAFRKLVSFGIAVLGSSIFGMLLSPFNKIMLSRYAGVAVIPVYEIAFNASFQVRNLIETAFRALVPEISRISANITVQAKERIGQIYRRSMRLIFLLGTPTYVTLVIVSPLLLKFWLGDRFEGSLPGVLRIMLLGTFLSLLNVPAYYIIMGLGKMSYCFLSHVIQGILNVVLVGIAIFSIKTLSAASVAFFSTVAMSMTTIYIIWQKQRVVRNLALTPHGFHNIADMEQS